MRVLVTGGAGFIGCHIVEALVARGDEPVVLDHLMRGGGDRLPRGIDLVRGDIVDPGIVEVIANLQPDAIIHAAAQVSVPRSMIDPAHDRAVNLLGTEHVLEGARRASAGRVVFLSTGGGIYGETFAPATEASTPMPASFYSVHKYAAERYLALSGIDHAVARLANVYGPGQRSGLEGGVVAIFAERLAHRQPITIYGTGLQRRDWVYVKDVADAVLLMLDARINGTWNVGTGRSTTLNALLSLMQEAIAPTTGVSHTEPRAGDVLNSSMSVDKIARELGWVAKTTLPEGVATLQEARLAGKPPNRGAPQGLVPGADAKR